MAHATAAVARRAGDVAPAEWWERLAATWAGFRAAHEVGWSRLARARTLAMWVAFLFVLALLVVSGTYRNSLMVSGSCLVLLLWWYALARTKTLSWRAVSVVFSAAIAWAPVVAWVTTKLSGRVAEALHYPLGGVSLAGASTAIAGFGEEALKLVPLLLLVLLAPGRVRRFATVDWLLVGFASGLGFQLFEDAARRLVDAVVKPGLFDLILGSADRGPGSGYPQYGLGPLAGGSSKATGFYDIAYAGHHVLTALVAVGIGLGVAAWRHARTTPVASGRSWVWRVAAVGVPAILFWVVVVDHFSYNASADAASWADPARYGQVSTVPVVLRWSSQVLGHGFGRASLLMGLLVVAMLVDSHRTSALGAAPRMDAGGRSLVPGVLLRFAGTMTGRPGVAIRAVRDLVVLVWGDLATVIVAHHRETSPDGDVEPRAVAARRGVGAAMMLRWERAEHVNVLVNPASTRSRGVRRGWRRVRVAALCALLLVAVIALWLAPALAEHIGYNLTRSAGSTWLAAILDALGGWWDGLSPGGQLAALIVVGAVFGLATGGLGTALFVSGIAGYGLSHAHGLATLTRNPRAAVSGYVSHLTPQGALLDALDLGLTFIPIGGGAVAGRGVKAAVGEFARDPDAWRAARQLALRGEQADAGMVRFDALGLKRPNTWREVVQDWRDGQQFNLDQWGRYDANEITLRNGRRLDSYTHELDIVSRKNSQLADLEPSTASAYLREHVAKYSPGEVIADTARARTEFPHLIGKPLDGKRILEVPVQNQPVPRELLKQANRLEIFIRDITGHIYQ